MMVIGVRVVKNIHDYSKFEQ